MSRDDERKLLARYAAEDRRDRLRMEAKERAERSAHRAALVREKKRKVEAERAQQARRARIADGLPPVAPGEGQTTLSAFVRSRIIDPDVFHTKVDEEMLQFDRAKEARKRIEKERGEEEGDGGSLGEEHQGNPGKRKAGAAPSGKPYSRQQARATRRCTVPPGKEVIVIKDSQDSSGDELASQYLGPQSGVATENIIFMNNSQESSGCELPSLSDIIAGLHPRANGNSLPGFRVASTMIAGQSSISHPSGRGKASGDASSGASRPSLSGESCQGAEDPTSRNQFSDCRRVIQQDEVDLGSVTSAAVGDGGSSTDHGSSFSQLPSAQKANSPSCPVAASLRPRKSFKRSYGTVASESSQRGSTSSYEEEYTDADIPHAVVDISSSTLLQLFQASQDDSSIDQTSLNDENKPQAEENGVRNKRTVEVRWSGSILSPSQLYDMSQADSIVHETRNNVLVLPAIEEHRFFTNDIIEALNSDELLSPSQLEAELEANEAPVRVKVESVSGDEDA